LAYAELLEILIKVEPQARVDDVKKKIQTLRSGYRKERNKVRTSYRSGAGTDAVYLPKLWYYKNLEFLNDQMEGT
jgi:hypothetical protein